MAIAVPIEPRKDLLHLNVADEGLLFVCRGRSRRRTLCCCHRLKSGLPAAICARTGAVLGRATPAQEAALGDYFLKMGLAFQIIDDVINLKVPLKSPAGGTEVTRGWH